MALVDDDQKVLGEEVQEAIRARARRASVEVARVVLNAAAVPQLAYHFDVVLHALFQPFCFERLAAGLEVGDLRHEVVLNLPYGKFLGIFRSKEKIGGINLIFLKNIDARAALGIYLLDAVDFVAPVSDADNVVGVGKVDIHAVALDAEVARRGRNVVARIEAGHKAAQEFVEAQLPPYFQFDDVFVESRGIAHAVNARDGRNYHHVLAAREQRGGSGEAQFVDVLVDGKVFLDIRIRGSDIGFGLIVIVVRNVILHRILGEKALELAVKLCRERLVVAKHERGLVQLCDDVCNGKRLSRAGNALQHLSRCAGRRTCYKLLYGFGLVARRLISGMEDKAVHCMNAQTRKRVYLSARLLIILLFHNVQHQFVELFLVHEGRRVEHHVAAGVVLREGDAVANAVEAGEERNPAVEAVSQAAVGRCAILEGVHQEAKLLLGALRRET